MSLTGLPASTPVPIAPAPVPVVPASVPAKPALATTVHIPTIQSPSKKLKCIVGETEPGYAATWVIYDSDLPDGYFSDEATEFSDESSVDMNEI